MHHVLPDWGHHFSCCRPCSPHCVAPHNKPIVNPLWCCASCAIYASHQGWLARINKCHHTSLAEHSATDSAEHSLRVSKLTCPALAGCTAIHGMAWHGIVVASAAQGLARLAFPSLVASGLNFLSSVDPPPVTTTTVARRLSLTLSPSTYCFCFKASRLSSCTLVTFRYLIVTRLFTPHDLVHTTLAETDLSRLGRFI